ncbi:hypothetical protein RHSIM_Rhsim05G0220200 [Rhododendron simsii]|uniref:Uncharacterized protein n=1 Tax=Rhododendron simsii TaxID=118357 RepID=A0A834H045_RHOSS|nr:hypothetical protein RHSIM_Rhsim05G0220200 [Rhododendron simsii]
MCAMPLGVRHRILLFGLRPILVHRLSAKDWLGVHHTHNLLPYPHSSTQQMYGGSKVFVASNEEKPQVRSRFLCQVGELASNQRLLSVEWRDLS